MRINKEINMCLFWTGGDVGEQGERVLTEYHEV